MIKHIALTLTILLAPTIGHAACPAAPVGSNQDRVIQMVAGGDNLTQMGSQQVTDATEEGAVVYDSALNTLVVCDGTNWITLGGGGLRTDCAVGSHLEWDGAEWSCAFTGPPTNCPNVGNICSDGTVYAGISPDGGVRMYTTPTVPPGLQWGSMGTNRSVFDLLGEQNTEFLAQFGAAAHPAAHYCYSLWALGRKDWYLPSRDEGDILRANSAAIGNYPANNFFWTSSQRDINTARGYQIPPGSSNFSNKDGPWSIRCIRKD